MSQTDGVIAEVVPDCVSICVVDFLDVIAINPKQTEFSNRSGLLTEFGLQQSTVRKSGGRMMVGKRGHLFTLPFLATNATNLDDML